KRREGFQSWRISCGSLRKSPRKFLAVGNDDRRLARSIGRSRCVKSQPLLEVVQQSLAYRHGHAVAGHAVVLRDDRSLALAERGIGQQFDKESLPPEDIVFRFRPWLRVAAAFKAARQQEIFELFVDVTIGAHVPP